MFLDRQTAIAAMQTRPAPTLQANAGPRLGDRIDLRLLVLCSDRNDPNLVSLLRIMDYIGMRYDVLVTGETALKPERLWQGTHAHYQGVVLATGYLGRRDSTEIDSRTHWYDPLRDDEWQTLHTFQARFGIRLATFCGIPRFPATTNAVVIKRPSKSDQSYLDLTLTDAGRRIFWYLRGDCHIPVESAAAVGIAPMTIAAEPLLEGPDGLNYAALWSTREGCEYLALTLEHSPLAQHTLLLGYGVLNWVTRGVFLGQRKVTLGVQIDDIFNANRLWNSAGGSENGGPIYRLAESDVFALVRWLDQVQARPNTAAFTLDFAFNGAAAAPTPIDGKAVNAFVTHRRRFRWINHGYTHLLLDDANQPDSRLEIDRNHDVARLLDLAPYEADCMVTADMSGLTNPSFLTAAAERGVHYLVCDTSRPGWNNPTPNTAIRSPIQPAVTMIPRHPNNLFYDVATPAAWVEQYNRMYSSFWQRKLTVTEIIQAEARQILQYLLSGDHDPLMFHQANLHAYDGKHSLLTDLLDEVFARYNDCCADAPILCPSMRTLGEMMVQRAIYDEARIDASLIVGTGLFLLADREVVVPLTGVRAHGADETYGGQSMATLTLKADVVRSIAVEYLVGYNGRPA